MNSIYDWGGKKILVVEDDDSSFIYISILFKTQNAIITRSIDGLDAFFICMTDAPDLIIMDIRLPVLNGSDTIRLIKKYQPHVPIISITASVMAEDRQNCLKAGCDAFVEKPVLPNNILPIVNYFLFKPKIHANLVNSHL